MTRTVNKSPNISERKVFYGKYTPSSLRFTRKTSLILTLSNTLIRQDIQSTMDFGLDELASEQNIYLYLLDSELNCGKQEQMSIALSHTYMPALPATVPADELDFYIKSYNDSVID
ncbi:unnamed protein product [Allacma fusca]|uniref:Uncharacterized protein n=1 Tax=Allacma fusca TaxID=39272 RepID=A0A8J2K5P2_9HEXA|nr:unnamed protein product [Allacma fusca]